jgi:hypothetical protein
MASQRALLNLATRTYPRQGLKAKNLSRWAGWVGYLDQRVVQYLYAYMSILSLLLLIIIYLI